MWTKHHRKRHFGRLIVPAITVAFVSYFGYHSVHGALGLKATEVFAAQKADREARLAILTHKRQVLEREVALLSDGSLERDMLDEKARSALNVSRVDEITIFH
ncbi:Cell division protein FtsB [Rhizobium sp. RU20A]|uniref:FtsB family cell division protein n=1 Tax=Rhizobium sp. RU20A TaxID=1907412 RepID=UPI0009548769|nr:septum formation initiator family protein [Rhizobium sp. RU20A]SIQ10723.1 Cell division protein FtsB [Rhizobium sp. RU20A]